MKKYLIKTISAAISVSMLPVFSAAVSANTIAVTVRLDPSYYSPFNNSRFEGWGTSIAWWGNRVGGEPELTKDAADKIFSDSGLSLDIARYNFGGGDDPSHDHINRSDSKVPGYAIDFKRDNEGNIIYDNYGVAEFEYDWTKDQNQRNVAFAALEANPELKIECFSVSPPYFLTYSGCSSGHTDKTKNNLKEEYYDEHAKFIAETARHFKDEWGITFDSCEPMNEPDTSYWFANSPKQEGCHFDPGKSQSDMYVAMRKALDREGLTDMPIAGMDETSIDKTVSNISKLSTEALSAIDRIDTHSYSGSKRSELRSKVAALGKGLRMSEVDNGGIKGENPGDMGAGLDLAYMILRDMNGMQPSAWVIWDILGYHYDSEWSYTDSSGKTFTETWKPSQSGGIWGVALANHDTDEVELYQKYYVYGQFTKYIEPGDTIIASSDTTLAAYNKDDGSIKIVAVNFENETKKYKFDLSAFKSPGTTVDVTRTSGSIENGEHWSIAENAVVENKAFIYDLIPNSVTTFVINNDQPEAGGYIVLDGESELSLRDTASYSAKTSDGMPVEWSIADESIAMIDENGNLAPLSTGTTDIIAYSSSLDMYSRMTINITNMSRIKIPLSKVTGSASWNNDAEYKYTNAFDGDISTFFAGLNGGYVQADLGDSYEIAAIEYASRKGFAYRMKDASFYGSNDGLSWTELYKFNEIPEDNVLTQISSDKLKSAGNYRYIKYSVPEGTFIRNGKTEEYCCDIAEISIYKTGEPIADPKLTEIDIVSADGSNGWSEDTGYEKALDNNISTYFDGAGGSSITMDLGASKKIGGIGFIPRPKDRYSYEERMIGGSFYGSNDKNEWELLCTIDSVPEPNKETIIYYNYFNAVESTDYEYRYIKYVSSKERNCSVSEINVYELATGPLLSYNIDEHGTVSYSISIPDIADDYIMYTAFYDKNGYLMSVSVGDSGTIETGGANGTLKCFVWNSDMEPIFDSISQTI